MRDRFLSLLLRPASLDRQTGLRLAADIGPPAVPLLWRAFETEKVVEHRLVLLGAAMIAGGTNEDDLLFAYLAQNRLKPVLRERTMIALFCALGPDRKRAVTDFWSTFYGATKDPKDQDGLLTVAVRLAAARFPGTASGMTAADNDDAGSAAAAAWAGLPVLPSIATRLWNLATPETHAQLYWRGAMLGAARQGDPSPAMLDRANRLAFHADTRVAQAATWLLASAHTLRCEGPRPEPALLRIMAGDPATVAGMAAWLAPELPPREEDRPSLAVAYVLSRPTRTVLEQHGKWPNDEGVRSHIAVALAMQMLGKSGAMPLGDANMPGVPEWNFVRWAAGGKVEPDVACKDARLQAVLQLILADRIDREAARIALEEALWRWGSHPRRGVWDIERLLVRDLLLAGSSAGGAKYQSSVPPNERYFPAGPDPGDAFFRVAVDIFDFLYSSRLPLPPEHRLPG